MPFTFAHPAIIIPFVQKRRRLFSATGLVVGSIAPDFESFIHLTDVKKYSHSWKGVFWYDLPLAFVIALVFHLLVRRQFILHLPDGLQRRFQKYLNVDWMQLLRNHYLMIGYSLLLGIGSHLVWDGFTHLNMRYPDAQWSAIMVGGTRLYILLQYACSILGMLVVGWWIYKMPTDERAGLNRKGRFKFWLFFALVAVFLIVFIRTMIFDGREVANAVLHIDFAISSLLGSLLIVSAAYTLVAPAPRKV